MIEALKQIGEYIQEKEQRSGVEKYTSLGKLENIQSVLVINLNQGKDEVGEIEYYEYDKEIGKKTLYSPGTGSNSPDLSPASKITTTEKTLKKIITWFEQNTEKKDNIETLKDVKTLKKLQEEYDNLKDEKTLLTIKIDNQWPSEIPEIIDKVAEAFKQKILHKHSKDSEGDGTCLLCGEEKHVYGFGFPYSFYTVDKKGFSPQFKQENSWKQLPLCMDCSTDLFMGMDFVDAYLKYSYPGGKWMFVYPKFITKETQDEIMEEIINAKTSDKTKYTDKEGGLITAEDDLSEILAEQEDYMTLIYTICQQKSGGRAFDVEKYIESVPPSWIKKIYRSFDETYAQPFFSEKSIKKIFEKNVGGFKGELQSKKNENTSLGWMLYTMFSTKSYDVITDILSENTINEQELLKHFNEKLRYNFKKDYANQITALKSIYILTFIKSLRDDDMEKIEEIEDLLDSSGKKAAFYAGALTGRLIGVQYARLDRNTPFHRKLYGLDLDVEKIKKRYPEAVDKLRQYEMILPGLEEKTSKYMMDAEKDGEDWGLTNNQASYYFTLGYTLNKLSKNNKKEDKKNE